MGISPCKETKRQKRTDRYSRAIRWLQIKKASHSHSQQEEKEQGEGRTRGRSKKQTLQETDMLREVWFAMGQPCGKRMQPALGAWLESMEKRQAVDIEKLQSISAATLDREQARFKVRKAGEKEDMLHLTSLKKSIPYVKCQAKLTEAGAPFS